MDVYNEPRSARQSINLQRGDVVLVNYRTQKRIPKQSFRWYQEVIRKNHSL